MARDRDFEIGEFTRALAAHALQVHGGMVRSLIALLLVAGLATAASADSTLAPKRRSVATLLSLAGAIVPYAMFLPETAEHPGRVADGFAWAGGAMVLALPSAGHWYAGEVWSEGLAFRLAGAAVIGASLWVATRPNQCCGFDPLPAMAAMGGAGLVIAGAAIDIDTARAAVDRWNRAHVEVVPTVMPIGAIGYGAGVVGRF